MRAVQLIAFDNNKNPFIPNEALLLLRSLVTTNLHVISVAGKYRTGKSYILNRVLLNRNQGFSVGHTINACTKGLWMWPELIRLDGKDCLIIDTEGLGSLEEGESTDLKIFLLALLFSSQLIYNSIGSIDEQAIESLSLVIQLATVLQRQDKYDTQELVNTFPAFMWLIRDFSLKLQNEKGVAITPQEYLEQALKHQHRLSQAAERKNQIRKQLRTFFQERDCFALVRPTEEERDLQNLSSVDDSKLRPEFVALVGSLKKRLSENVKPKRVRGRVLSMDGFIQLCQYYTKALVDGKLPTISSHWDNLCLAQTHRIFQKYQFEHLKAMESLEEDLGKMTATHKLIVKEGMDAIEKSFLGKLEKQLFKERFERKLESQLQEIKGRMNYKKNKEVKVLLESIEQGISPEDDLLMRYEAVIMKMSQMSETSSKDEGLYLEFYLYICQFARSLLEESSNKRYEEQQIANNKIQFLEKQLSDLREQIMEENSAHDEELSQLRKKVNEFQYLNSKQQNEKQEKTLIQLYELRSSNKDMCQQIKELNERLQLCQLEASKKQLAQRSHLESISALEQALFQQEKQVLEKDALLNLETIKFRKMMREKEIIKQRYEENLEENLKMRTTIDYLESQIVEIEDRKYSENGFNSDVEEMRRNLRLCEEERKNLSRLLEDQRTAFEALMHAPQNISYNALKRNFELEQEQRLKLEEKLSDFLNLLDCCSKIICSRCQLPFSPRNAKQHFRRCSEKEPIEFDVSYSYNPEGELAFQISISKGLSQWTIHRSLQDIRSFFMELDETDHVESFEEGEDDGSRYEEMRMLLDSFLNNHKQSLSSSSIFARFFSASAVR